MSGSNEQRQPHPWNWEELEQAPQVYPAPEFDEGNVKAIYYDGMPYGGKPTRVFAYYALPDAASEEGGLVPAMVLVHGGGGTAFKEWVELWRQRGYAAIAMDLEGHLPLAKDSEGRRPQHDWSGPARQGEFGDYALPVEEQWMYHAVAAVIRAHSFIRSIEQVDRGRIGINGFSWGGIVTGIVSGVDDRFMFSIPVYGCGYLYESMNRFGEAFRRMPQEDAERIKRLWDPSVYLPRATKPMLWVNGDQDQHFSLDLFSRSYEKMRSRRKESLLSIQFGLGHSHVMGWKPQEIYAFADQMTKGAEPLIHTDDPVEEGSETVVRYAQGSAVKKAELRYAVDTSDWFAVQWLTADARILEEAREIRAVIPANAKAYFIRIADEREYVVCSAIRYR
ncbi:Prolyl oligopeptidase family protein [Paenibacillus konkukensis]|uniref:Prolyl oligopeptidase family protein n=1 Tax=Paenibacillus konkukensis TaxID=2020716 RepID=A0ABY4RPT5_9BACL|nr:alpha/beta fold hydrolase [Paenibacillus konkukensis]UQZ83990.1 Prolyl oligopeptidase family protein [Paenibacillus konkukensis]